MLNRLKLRASFGYTGSQGFSSYNAITTFRYYNNDSYNGYIGSYAYALSNPDLRWQETYDTNFGLDFELFGSRLTGRVDYYISDTKGMITDVTVPATTGFSTYVANLGETENKGVEAYLNYRVYENLQKGNYINVYVNAAHNKNTLKSISNSLRAWNDEQDANMMEEGITTPSVKYYEGCSMTAIWAVKSLGIDPQTGQEIFVNRDGRISYDWVSSEQQILGDTEPEAQGSFGVNLRYKNFTMFASFLYEFGAQAYNSTLVEKVECVDLRYYNADKRVLTERWQHAGQATQLKDIADRTETTRPTSRFVQDYNAIDFTSFSLSYDFNTELIRKIGMSMLRLQFQMTDVAHISNVKQERGLTYPYSRTFNLSVNVTF